MIWFSRLAVEVLGRLRLPRRSVAQGLLGLLAVLHGCSSGDAADDVPNVLPRLPDDGWALVVVLEPGSCISCDRWFAETAAAREKAPGRVLHVWRRLPTDAELSFSRPVNTLINGVLARPWPATSPPNGVAMLLLEDGLVSSSDRNGSVQERRRILLRVDSLLSENNLTRSPP